MSFDPIPIAIEGILLGFGITISVDVLLTKIFHVSEKISIPVSLVFGLIVEAVYIPYMLKEVLECLLACT